MKNLAACDRLIDLHQFVIGKIAHCFLRQQIYDCMLSLPPFGIQIIYFIKRTAFVFLSGYNMQFALKVYEQFINGNLSVCAIMKNKIRFSGAPEGT